MMETSCDNESLSGLADRMHAVIPNWLYIGTSKAGSTWLFDLLARHPDVYVAPSKGLYFFDGHFDYGWPWYFGHFRQAADAKAVGEISHSYLYSVDACQRIAELNPEMRLLVCVREPAERAFSDYLDLVKNCRFDGPFESALREFPHLIDRGRYATHLAPYLDRFGRDRMHIAKFDDLFRDPEGFARRIYEFLGVRDVPLPPTRTKKMMPAGQPRSRPVVLAAKRASKFLRRTGFRSLVGRVKRSRLIRNALYQEFAEAEKPQMQPQTRATLRAQFRDEIARLDALWNGDFCESWGYD